MSKRTIGITAIALGFVLATVAGILLSLSNLDLGQLGIRALLAFVIVMPIMIFGIYFYVTSGEIASGLSETQLQLQLVDIIRERNRVSMDELAQELGISTGRITQLVEDLDSLDLFTGYIDWNNGVVFAQKPQELRDSNE